MQEKYKREMPVKLLGESETAVLPEGAARQGCVPAI